MFQNRYGRRVVSVALRSGHFKRHTSVFRAFCRRCRRDRHKLGSFELSRRATGRGTRTRVHTSLSTTTAVRHRRDKATPKPELGLAFPSSDPLVSVRPPSPCCCRTGMCAAYYYYSCCARVPPRFCGPPPSGRSSALFLSNQSVAVTDCTRTRHCTPPPPMFEGGFWWRWWLWWSL